MSKHQRRKLTIYYQVGGKRLKQSFRTVQELLDLDTDSHKHNNPMAPTNDTKITCVAWKGCALFDETYSLGEVKRLLKGFDLTKRNINLANQLTNISERVFILLMKLGIKWKMLCLRAKTIK